MKKQLLTAMGIMACATMMAAPLSPDKALGRYYRTSGMKARVETGSKINPTPAYTAMTPSGNPAAYIFNMTDGNGYRIISADDATEVLIGYSDTGYISEDNMPDNMRWWLDEMGRQVQIISNGYAEGTAPVLAGENFPALAPLCKSKWNQDAPYNNMCPKVGSRNTVTGCVATSMAQLMYYHKYPEAGEGSITYKWNYTPVTYTFGEQNFDWENMLDVYRYGQYSEVQASAVAYLMVSCGYSVEMDFGVNASGTQGVLISEALKKYFKYDKATTSEFRVVYSASDWARKTYENIRDIGPVIFNGHPYDSAGHSFVCDGYDGDGYFHFNWGWGGMSDGYFLLELMDPESQGIGGSTGGGFVYGLNGIFNAQPPTGQDYEPVPDNMVMYGSLQGTIEGDRLRFSQTAWYPQGWQNAEAHNIEVNLGAIIEPVDGTPGEVMDVSGFYGNTITLRMTPGSWYPSNDGPNIKTPALADGRYKVTLGVKDKLMQNSVHEPILHCFGCANYVYLNVAGGVYTVENVPQPVLQPENMVSGSGLYYNMNTKFNVTFMNSSDYELTETYAPVLLQNGNVKFQGYSVPCTVDANNTTTIDWITPMTPVNGQGSVSQPTTFTMGVMKPNTSEVVGTFGEVTMQPQKANGIVEIESFMVEGCDTVMEIIMNQLTPVYLVPNGNNFIAKLKIMIADGFFDKQLSLNLGYRNPDNQYDIIDLEEGLFRIQPMLDTDETATYDAPISWNGAESADKTYLIKAVYQRGKNTTTAGYMNFRVLNASVTGISDDAAPVKYYNMQGVEIENPSQGDIVIVRQGNKTYKKVVR